MTERMTEARFFGERAANTVIAAMIDRPDSRDRYLRDWHRNERQFCEWQFENYHPELVP